MWNTPPPRQAAQPAGPKKKKKGINKVLFSEIAVASAAASATTPRGQ